ncbi:MAG: 3-deoxy-D-manno-octulosonic acid transferase [Candidatus Cloacimonetes bacterium]|nr:3-deoxy-D-manno-octulosonic acid transferase [Candidatus Cloacimonadota bacterium]
MLHQLVRLLLLVLMPALLPAMLLRRGWRETRARLGRGLPSLLGCVWIHAASVGEVNAVRPLIEAMRRQWPQRPLLLTTMTTTGLVQAARLEGVQAHLVPLDMPLVVAKAFRRVRPDMLVLVETELWPEMLRQARRFRVPVTVVNGRLSARSVRRYRRYGLLWRPLLRSLASVGAQSKRDGRRYRLLWQPRAEDTGNLKFCMRFPDYDRTALRREWGLADGDFVVVFGSSRPGEEALLRQALPRLREAAPGRLRVILVPRHLRRLDDVTAALEGADFSLRSEGRAAEALVVDEMGALAQAYALCDLALVGGSFYPGFGGHNPIEPTYFGIPTIMGPHHESCRDSVRILREGGGLLVVAAEGLADALARLASSPDERAELGAAGREIVRSNAQSVEKNLAMLQNVLDSASPVW